MAVVAAGKAYVTNLVFGGPGTVTVLDLATHTVTGTITVGDSPEGLAVLGDRAYVANSGFGASTTVSILDTGTDTVVETRDVGCDGPRFVVVDQEEEVWVFCTGKTVYNDDFTQIIEQTNGEVVVYDGASGGEVARFPLEVQIGGGSLGQDVHYDPITDRVFALAGTTVLVFDTRANAAAGSIPLAGDVPAGGLAYDGAARRFYVGRVPGFVENGFVTIHDDTGAEVGRFEAGVAPAAVALYQPGLDVAVEEAPAPAGFTLAPNYPNPFSTSTTIPFALTRPGRVTLQVFDGLGREVARLVEGMRPAGRHEVVWHAAGRPAGLYLVRLQVGTTVRTYPLTLIR
ncbi:T9SS type A sorting domain-containing protein [Rhodocaloribacter litoris]|nr:T9SS type A sorting domain-containing protein [Rhodocaloribacter litoris]